MSDDQGFTYDPKTGRYRNAATGRFLTQATVTSLRNEFVGARSAGMVNLVTGLLPIDHAADPLAWMAGMRQIETAAWREIQRTYAAQVVFGRGGLGQMTSRERLLVQTSLEEQRGYWNRFMAQAQAGGMSRDQVAHRASLYVDASTRVFEEARAMALDITLPAYPGDGGTDCMMGCKCTWDIRVKKHTVEATWHIGGSVKPCAGCASRARQYSPHIIERSTE